MKSPSRLAVVAAVGIVAAALALAGCGTKNTLAAKVNGRPIEASALDTQLAQMKKASPQSFETSDSAAVELDYKAKILENLIQIELIKEVAEKEKVTVTDAQVTDYIGQLEAQYGGKSGLQDAMAQSGMTEQQLKDAVKSRLLVDAVREKVTKAPDVPDSAAKDYYDKNAALFQVQAQYHAAHILLAEADKAKAESVLAQIKAGGDFAALAKANSVDTGSKDAGGDLDWAPSSKYVAEFGAALEKMKAGEVRLVHTTQFGWHIVKLIESKPASKKTFEEVKSQIVEMLGEQDRSDQFTKYLNDLRNGAKVEIFDEALKKVLEADRAASQSATATP